MVQNITNIEQIKECIDAFSLISNTGCELCSLDGEVNASAGFSCDICSLCENTGIQKVDCKRLHAFTAKAAVDENGRYIYECLLGFSCITAAVINASGNLMRLTCGPFLMEDAEDFRDFTLRKDLSLSDQQINQVMEGAKRLPVREAFEVNAISSLLVCCASYISKAGDSDYLANLEASSILEWESINKVESGKVLGIAISYIAENYSKEIKLNDIAEKAGVTTSYLCRIFKKSKGITINSYITKLRIEKSKDLLLGNTSISDIAELCGFADQSYFTKVFRQQEGITPLKFRKQSLENSV